MKIRHVLIAIVVVIIANTAFNGISGALKRSDYNHCRVTSHMTVQECEDVTGYTVAK